MLNKRGITEKNKQTMFLVKIFLSVVGFIIWIHFWIRMNLRNFPQSAFTLLGSLQKLEFLHVFSKSEICQGTLRLCQMNKIIIENNISTINLIIVKDISSYALSHLLDREDY